VGRVCISLRDALDARSLLDPNLARQSRMSYQDFLELVFANPHSMLRKVIVFVRAPHLIVAKMKSEIKVLEPLVAVGRCNTD
jgi:hypothetical protein